MQQLRLLQERASSPVPVAQLPDDVKATPMRGNPGEAAGEIPDSMQVHLDHLAAKQLTKGRSNDDDHRGKLDCLLSGFHQRSDGGLEFSLASLLPRNSHSLFPSYSPRRFKITPRSISITVTGPLDGILCLKVRDEANIGKVFVLWFPITGEAKSIRPPLTKSSDFFGLGRDPRTDEYKILTLSIHKTSQGGCEKISYKTKVRTLGHSSSWRVLDVSYFFDGSRWIDDAAYSHMRALAITRSMTLSADGRMLSMLGRYKLLGNNGSVDIAFSVVSFDSSDEIFIETPLPPPCGSPVGCYTKMHCHLCC
ncbi:hypothetical protein Dimus_032034 [Dionaea muscipula]